MGFGILLKVTGFILNASFATNNRNFKIRNAPKLDDTAFKTLKKQRSKKPRRYT